MLEVRPPTVVEGQDHPSGAQRFVRGQPAQQVAQTEYRMAGVVQVGRERSRHIGQSAGLGQRREFRADQSYSEFFVFFYHVWFIRPAVLFWCASAAVQATEMRL